MNPIAAAVISSGLLDPVMVEEMRRWGIEIAEPKDTRPQSVEELAGRIREALEGEGYVLVRETDLTVLQQYAATMQQGNLHLVLDVDDDLEEDDIPITFGRTPLNEYILPWKSTGIADVLANGMTYLDDGPSRVYFRQVRELFFGGTKAFMICEPGDTGRSPVLG